MYRLRKSGWMIQVPGSADRIHSSRLFEFAHWKLVFWRLELSLHHFNSQVFRPYAKFYCQFCQLSLPTFVDFIETFIMSLELTNPLCCLYKCIFLSVLISQIGKNQVDKALQWTEDMALKAYGECKESPQMCSRLECVCVLVIHIYFDYKWFECLIQR